MQTIQISRVTGVAIVRAPAGLTAVLLPVPRDSAPAVLSIVPPALASGAIHYAPSLLVDAVIVAPQPLLPAAMLYAPTLAVGLVTITPAALAADGQAFAPAVLTTAGLEVRPNMLGPTALVYAPAVAGGIVTVAPPALTAGSQAYAPAVQSGAVSISMPALPSTLALYAPVIAPGMVTISPAISAGTSVSYAPQVQPGLVQVAPNVLAPSSIAYVPTISVQAAGYDADAAALFSAMSVQPDANRKGRINDLIVGLKADGVWTKLDWLVLLAASTSQQALLNWRAPSKALQSVNSPTFTPDKGFTGDGVTSHLSFNEAFNAAGNLFALASAHIGAWCNQMSATSGSRPHIGSSQSTRTFMSPANAGNAEVRVNDSTAAYFEGTTRLGHRTGVRSDAVTKKYYRDGLNTQTFTVSGGAVATGPAYVLRNGTNYADDRIAVVYTGAGLTDADVASIHARLNTYLSSFGAN